jgi:hypothetical protein
MLRHWHLLIFNTSTILSASHYQHIFVHDTDTSWRRQLLARNIGTSSSSSRYQLPLVHNIVISFSMSRCRYLIVQDNSNTKTLFSVSQGQYLLVPYTFTSLLTLQRGLLLVHGPGTSLSTLRHQYLRVCGSSTFPSN